ncbi:MAG: NUDIX hydrolase [Pseudomonadota bacterium]
MSDKPNIRVGVGAVVFRDQEVLLVKRGKPPLEGQWSLPGGGLEFGESVRAATLREIKEETNVEARLLSILDVYDVLPRNDHPRAENQIVIVDYVAEWVSGTPRAGDDAVDAEFVDFDGAIDRVSWAVTREAIRHAAKIRAALAAAP